MWSATCGQPATGCSYIPSVSLSRPIAASRIKTSRRWRVRRMSCNHAQAKDWNSLKDRSIYWPQVWPLAFEAGLGPTRMCHTKRTVRGVRQTREEK